MKSVFFTGEEDSGHVWPVPPNTHLILVSGCGPGGIGGDSTGTTGGGGGGGAPFIYRLPLLVSPGLPIAIRIGSNVLGNYFQSTWIAGPGLIDPLCLRDGYTSFFSFGYGVDAADNSQYGAHSNTNSPDDPTHAFFFNAHHPPQWNWPGDRSVATWWEGPSVGGDGSNPSGDPYTYNLPGFFTVNGHGIGDALASDPTNRSGGPGGGNLWGKGGQSGQYGGTVNGGDASGYGSGGGGAANGGVGGAPTSGIVRFEW